MLVSKQIVGTVAPQFGLPSVLTAFAKSYAEMMTFSQIYLCGPSQILHTVYPRHSYHPIARNECAKEALGEFIFMIDTDHAFAPDLLFRMYNAMRRFDAEVVTAVYLHKNALQNPTLWRFNDDGTHDAVGWWRKGEAISVDCAGAGALLIKNRVFDRIRDELHEEPFSTQEFKQVIGEDFAFFRRLKKLNIPVLCPTYIECPHLAVRPLRMWKDYNPDESMLGEEYKVKAMKEASA